MAKRGFNLDCLLPAIVGSQPLAILSPPLPNLPFPTRGSQLGLRLGPRPTHAWLHTPTPPINPTLLTRRLFSILT